MYVQYKQLNLILLGVILTVLSTIASAGEDINAIHVNTVSDTVANDGRCSLREAITSANTDAVSGALPGECEAGEFADHIFIPAGTYILASQLPDITHIMRLVGEATNPPVIDANQNGEAIVNVNVMGQQPYVSFISLVFRGGSHAEHMIRIAGSSSVTISKSTFQDNIGPAAVTVTGESYVNILNSTFIRNVRTVSGGVIRLGDSAGALARASAFISNSAQSGGAIALFGTSRFTAVGSVFFDNQASGSGGAIFSGVGTRLAIAASTLYRNVANSDQDGFDSGGGIYLSSTAELFLSGSIVAGNLDLSPLLQNRYPDMFNSDRANNIVTTDGSNFIGSNKGMYQEFTLFGNHFAPSANTRTPNASKDYVGSAANPFDPLLGPLRSNGGPTPSLLPLKQNGQVSPVIDAAECKQGNLRNEIDQRTGSSPRQAYDFDDISQPIPPTVAHSKTYCDIGATEFQKSDLDEGFMFPIRAANGNVVMISL